ARDRTGRALLAAGPGSDAAGGVGSHPAPVRRAGIVDHGRGPRTLRGPGYPAARRGRHRVPGLLAVPLCLARHPPVTRTRRLLEVAAVVSPSQPPGAPAGDRRTRRRCRRLRPADPARGPAIRREDSLRCSWLALTARADPLMR